MPLGRIFEIGMSIVTVALVFVLVNHSQTVEIVKAAGQAFASSLRVATTGK